MEEMPKEIRTKRLTLRPFRLSDVDDVYEYAQDPEWARFLPVPQPYLRSDAEEFVARQLAASWPDEPSWAIVLEGKVIGALNLHDLNSERRTAALGYAVARARWSQGFATEAVKAVMTAAFKDLNLKRVWAVADVRNIASQRVMEKAGMIRKRLVQEDPPSSTKPVDWVLYAILREEWEISMYEMPREIRTERLLLRPFRSSDVDDVYEYAQDPEWGPFLPVPQPYLRSDAEEFVARQLAASWPDEPSWAIVLEGKVIGALNLHDLNRERRIVGLGYAVARARWSQGFATEAAKAAIAAAFRSLGLKRIWAMADVRNIASQRVMEKAEMTRKRLVQEDAPSGGPPVDMVLYEVSREEWEA